MSDTESLMWTLEKDPHLRSTFATVTVFDRPLDDEVFRARMRRVVRRRWSLPSDEGRGPT